MSEAGPYRGGRVHVLSEKCATCIFRRGNLMNLVPGRLADMVRTAVSRDSAITCHSTLLTDEQAVCRGFWDGYRDASAPLRLAQILDVVDFDPPPPGHRGEEGPSLDPVESYAEAGEA